MNSSVNAARLRLVALWIAVLTRAAGENAVRAYAVMKVSDGANERSLGFLFLLLGLSAVPAFALAPLIGAIACSRGRWAVMILATLAGLAAIGWSTYEEYQFGQTDWYRCIGVLAFETAFFGACCFAILPEAARAARVSLPQSNGLFAVAAGAGIFAGMWIGIEQFLNGKPGMPVPLQFGHIGYGLALIFVLFSRFQPDEPIRFNDGLMVPFLRTARGIFRDRDGRNALLALWGLYAVGLAVTQWLMPQEPAARYGFFAALIVGLVVGSLHPHPYRTLGIVPYAAIGLAVCASWAVLANNWADPANPLGFFLGLCVAPLLTIHQIRQPDASRGHGGALLQCGWAFITGAFLIFLLMGMLDPLATKRFLGYGTLALCLIGLLFAWLVFFRAAFEWSTESLLRPFYRIKATGPGVHSLPRKGPLLIIANHSAWFDPLWLGKVVPFPITPMMTSRFYDLRVIGWLVRKVICAIRVLDVPMRKDAPEIQEAITALDRGECVVIFPEGWLRRKEDQELRRFGRGIWQILKARPHVPVFACWIEGGWGSYVSYRNGPPMKNKKIDFLRPINIAILDSIQVDAATLETHMATRTMLMKKVLEARTVLGLVPIDPFTLQAHEQEEEKAERREG